jgi:hypothetical protein
LRPIQYELSPTFFTRVILFAVVNMAVLFDIRAVTAGAMFLHGSSPCYLGDIKEDNQNS